MAPSRHKAQCDDQGRGVSGCCSGLLTVVLLLLLPASARSEFDESSLRNSIVTITNHRGKSVIRQGSGVVVQADRFNGYVVTNAALLVGSDTLTVRVPDTGAELVAQILREETSIDFALLKVNGLDLTPMRFSYSALPAGASVWAAARAGENLVVSKGVAESSYPMPGDSGGAIRHTASGTVLLNNCGEIVGLTRSDSAVVEAIDGATIRQLLGRQNVKVTVASSTCVSQVDEAREKAETAAAQARLAQDEAESARRIALDLELKLKDSSRCS